MSALHSQWHVSEKCQNNIAKYDMRYLKWIKFNWNVKVKIGANFRGPQIIPPNNYKYWMGHVKLGWRNKLLKVYDYIINV